MSNSKKKGAKRERGAKDYVKLIEWSDEDHCYVGRAPPLVDQCCHGDDEGSVCKQLCQIVEECVQLMKEDGTPLPDSTASREYSGKFIVRVPPSLHRLFALRASRDGESLNSYIVACLEKA